jgi:hypothetical protein
MRLLIALKLVQCLNTRITTSNTIYLHSYLHSLPRLGSGMGRALCLEIALSNGHQTTPRRRLHHHRRRRRITTLITMATTTHMREAGSPPPPPSPLLPLVPHRQRRLSRQEEGPG